jgi:hypothetical protein
LRDNKISAPLFCAKPPTFDKLPSAGEEEDDGEATVAQINSFSKIVLRVEHMLTFATGTFRVMPRHEEEVVGKKSRSVMFFLVIYFYSFIALGKNLLRAFSTFL